MQRTDNGLVPPEEVEHPEADRLVESALPPAILPNYSQAIRQAILPNYSQLARDVSALHNLEGALRSIVAPRFATSMLSSVQPSRSGMETAGFRTSAEALFETMGLEDTSDLTEVDIRPTTDESAFLAIAGASPEVAAAISSAAENAGNPLLPAHVIRNMLAWLVVIVIVVAYIGGTVLFPPWGPVLVASLSASGLTAPAAYGRIRQSPEGEL